MTPDLAALHEFARRYTAAWCSQDPASVAAHFSPEGSITINDGSPSLGRAAITEMARFFMTTFPDLQVLMDGLDLQDGRTIYRWTLIGGPVRISGYEQWTFGPDGLIAESFGHFDAADYQRQLLTPPPASAPSS